MENEDLLSYEEKQELEGMLDAIHTMFDNQLEGLKKANNGLYRLGTKVIGLREVYGSSLQEPFYRQ